MAKQPKQTSKVASEALAVNVAVCVAATFGKLDKARQDMLAGLSRYNKHVQALMFHALCASLGVSRQTARTRINAFIGTMHKGNKPALFDGENFIAEAYKVDAAGNYKSGTLDSYSQQAKFDFYSRPLPQALTQKQGSELAVLLASDYAASTFAAIKSDSVLGKLADKKTTWKAAQKDLCDKLAKVA